MSTHVWTHQRGTNFVPPFFQGQDIASLQFLFDGDRLKPEQTPQEVIRPPLSNVILALQTHTVLIFIVSL